MDPSSCQWVSEVTPDAVIRFSSTNGVGTYNGILFYKGKRVIPFQEGQAQGYGSHRWSSGEKASGSIVQFIGHQVVRGTPKLMGAGRPQGVQRVLIVGLGSDLYYASDPSWRSETTLLTAAEGFWRWSSGCRSFFR